MKKLLTKSELIAAMIILLLVSGVAFTKGIYSDVTNPKSDIETALESSAKDGKKIMLIFGADWCPWCNLLAKYIKEEGKVKTVLEKHYRVVKVDVGKWNANMDLVEKYKVNRKAGIPSLVVLDEKGKWLAFQETGTLEKGKWYDDAKVLNFLGGFLGKHDKTAAKKSPCSGCKADCPSAKKEKSAK